MKKGVVLGLALGVLILLMINSAPAISSDLRESYSRGETMIVKLSGNVMSPIFPSQVEFLKGYVKVSFEYDVKKLGGDYYLYANAPASASAEEGVNYSLVIKNITTTINNKQERVDYAKNFTFSNASAEYSVSPGIVFAKDDFEINAYLNGDEDKTIDAGFPERSVTLKPGLNEIKFSIDEFYGAQVNMVQIGMYSVPAYVIGDRGTPVVPGTGKIIPGINEEMNKDLVFSPNPLEIIVNESSFAEQVFQIELKNRAERNYSGVNITYNDSLFSIDDGLGGVFSGHTAGENIEIATGESYYFNLTLTENPSSGRSEIVYAEYENASSRLFAEISLLNETAEEMPVEEPDKEKVNYYCSEMQGGKVCAANEKCTGGEAIITLDAECCVNGTCEVEEAEGGSGMIIGVIIIVFVAILLIYVWYSYKKTGSINPFKRKVAEAEKKMGEGP